MEKPFGTDLRAPANSTTRSTTVFPEQQIFRIDHFLGKEAAQNILALRFANGLFEPIWNRSHIAHVQIDVPETLSRRIARQLLRGDRRLPRHGRHPPDADPRLPRDGAADRSSLRWRSPRRRTRSSARSARSTRPTSCAGQYEDYRSEPGVAPDSETETMIALRCEIDNWRWSGVPFYLRTGKRMAEGARIISIAFREPPQSMFPAGSGRRRVRPRPPHLRPQRLRPALAVVLRQAARARR